ncbi:hypothetical protein LE181_03490 [Streptomyces sp. SCA3-4]|uniref:hypothetical protein n=1 Tax=Streptomyces sichuanensis TaxID=2871810 RepID=UPI001CE34F39|nr:hypothetical protein [Streptomyces sichuanensis]MCA6091233.1 hypothetical protein [Streptomyces sichuanensis]
MADESRIHNVMQGTAEYVLQIGQVHGNVSVHLPPGAEPLERAAWSLARSIRAQWTAELTAWDLASADPLSVHWQATWAEPRHGAAHGDRKDPVQQHGPQIARMADTFLGLARRRLVVLGAPGAGKSTLAVLLTLELAERCLPGARRIPGAPGLPGAPGPRALPEDGVSGEAPPVPVVLTLESWDPDREHFRAWLARRIAEDHPGLPRVDGRHPAARLVQERRILPVLDGLDELPGHRRPVVVREIDRALGDKDALVLTSRTAEYRAGEERGAAIAGAAVIEARPVGLAEATAYLLHSAAPQTRRSWKLMLDEVDQQPDGPVAQALSSPLMIWLARQGFRTPPADPLDLARRPFRSREEVEKHLLDLIIPAVFTQQPHAPDRLHAPRQWNHRRARHWLSSLAGHLSRRRTTELAWWDLHRTLLVRLTTPLVLLLVCLALSRVAATAGGWFVDRQTSGDRLGALGGFTTQWGLELAVSGGLVHAMGVWIAVEVWFGFKRWRPRRRANPFRIGAALRSAGRAASVGRALKAAAVVVVPAGLFTLMALGTHDPRPYLVMALCSTVVAPVLMVTIAAPADTEDASTPDEVLGSERTAALLSMGTVAVAIGIGQGALGWYTYGTFDEGMARAVAGWFGASAMLLLMSSWSRWLMAKGCLATVGRVPWSLMEFLRDAHHGGLLQRSGGVYRFRHLRLQEHLAAGAPAHAAAYSPAVHGRPLQPVGPSPATAATAPAATGFRDLVVGAEQSALSSRKGWTVHSDGHTFTARSRQRQIRMAHWPSLLVFAAMVFIRFGVEGHWRRALLSSVVFCGFGVVIMLLGWLMPPRLMELHMTAESVAFTLGRRRHRLAWADVEDVALRKLIHRKKDTKTYALHVRLRPGAPEPARYFRGNDGWFFILPLSVTDTVPVDLAAALRHFAGARWRPPLDGPAQQNGHVIVHNEVSGQVYTGEVIQAGTVRGDVTLGQPDANGTTHGTGRALDEDGDTPVS